MRTGHIFVVATQVDLCDDQEVNTKMEMLKNKVSVRMDAELEYIQKLNEKNDICEERQKLHVSFIETSSSTFKGLQELKYYLYDRTKEYSLTLPAHWRNMYRKLLDQKLETRHYLGIEEVGLMFQKSLPLNKRLVKNRVDFQLCLQLLHGIGMLLWYGDNENLKDVVFHKTSFIITVLKCLFRHNLQQHLPYNHETFGKFIGTRIQYETEMEIFLKTGMLSQSLLRYVWAVLNLHSEDVTKLIHVLKRIDLCYFDPKETDDEGSVTILRFPWFIQRDDRWNS